MRQVIKGDGSDGTAAAKAYLLAHDNLMRQELYEFTKPAITMPGVAAATTFPDEPTTSGSFVPNADGIANPTWGSASATADGGVMTRSNSSPFGGYFAPGDLYWNGCDAPYLAPGTDDTGAPSRSLITKVEAILSIDLTTLSGQTPNYACQVSVDGGSAYHGIGGFPANPGAAAPISGTPGTYHYDLSLDITSLITIATFDFSLIKFHFSQSASAFWPGGTVTVTLSGIGLRFTYSSAPISGTPKALPYVCDASSALTYAGNQYNPATIKNNGFKSKIGLDVDSLQLTWALRGDEALVTDPNTGATILTVLQGFQYGLLEGYWVKWRRSIMPTFGDCDSIGCESMFRGRIAEVEVDRLTAKITVNSVTDLFNRQIPQQLIEANNRSMQVGPGLPPDLDPDPAHWSVMTCEAGHGGTVTKIVARQTQPTADEVYAPGTFDMGYLWFQNSPFEDLIAQVRHYEVIAGFNVFYLFRPLYADPHAFGAKFIAFVPVPKDQDVSGSSLVELKGFPWVPLPEQAV